MIRDFLEMVSDDGSLDVEGSPQNLALNWIIEEDAARLCPLDENLIQRYSLAVFYYSTEGDDWFQCSAPGNLDDPADIEAANEECMITATGSSSSDAWLTPSSECSWGGLSCADGMMVDALEIGTFQLTAYL